MRVTKQRIQANVDLLNDMAGNPREPYVGRDDSGNLRVNAGVYVVNYDYGQPRLEQMSPGGGARSIGPRLPKGQFIDVLAAYIDGFEAGMKS